jgi:drug/metabolite transporter (DMT)-like permease
MLVIANILWGANYAISKYGFEAWNPLAFSVTRFLVAGAIFGTLVRRREGPLRPHRADVKLILACAFVGILLNQLTFTGAADHTTAGNVVLIMTAAPALAAFFAMVAGHEHVHARHWGALGIAVVGVLLVVLGGTDESGASLYGDLLAVGAAATWAAYSVMLRPLFTRYSASRISALVIVWGGLMLVPVSASQVATQNWGALDAKAVAAWLYSGIFALVTTNLLYFRGLRSIGASRATLYMYIQPFVGVIVAALLLGESLAPIQAVGGIIILVGVSLGNLMPAATVRE